MKEISDVSQDCCGIDMQFQRVNHYPFHWHPSLEVILVLEGSVHISLIDDTKVIKKGDVEILNINQTHRLWATAEKNMVLIMQIDADLARQYVPDLDMIWFSHAFSPSLNVENNRLQALIAKIYEIVLLKYSSNQMTASMKEPFFSQLLNSLIETFDIMKIQYGDNPSKFSRIRRTFDYLHNQMNYLNKITLQDISTQTEEFLNLDYLSALFRNCTGDNFLNLLHYFRIEYAVKQLLSTNKSITEIAFACGYSATRYFYKHFKQLFPEGPRVFRKNNLDELADNTLHSFDAVNPESGLQAIQTLSENYRSTARQVCNRWIGIYLTELDALTENKSNSQCYFFHAKDFQCFERKKHFESIIENGNFDKIFIHGLFSNPMIETANLNKTEEGKHNFERINNLLRFLQNVHLIPSFFLEYSSAYINKFLVLLDEFMQNYICLYGEEEINQWRFQLITENSLAHIQRGLLPYQA